MIGERQKKSEVILLCSLFAKATKGYEGLRRAKKGKKGKKGKKEELVIGEAV